MRRVRCRVCKVLSAEDTATCPVCGIRTPNPERHAREARVRRWLWISAVGLCVCVFLGVWDGVGRWLGERVQRDAAMPRANAREELSDAYILGEIEEHVIDPCVFQYAFLVGASGSPRFDGLTVGQATVYSERFREKITSQMEKNALAAVDRWRKKGSSSERQIRMDMYEELRDGCMEYARKSFAAIIRQ